MYDFTSKMYGDPFLFILIASMLVSSFLFGGMEIAFIAANKLKIELDKKRGVFASGTTSHFGQHPRLFIAAMIIGQHLSFVIYTYCWWQIVGNYLLHETTWPYLITLAAFTVFTALFLFFSEFLAKAVFSHNSNNWLRKLTLPTALFYFLFYPLSLIVSAIATIFRKPSVEDEGKARHADFGRIDLNEYIEQVTSRINDPEEVDHEIQIFRNALDFSKVKARDCLVPRNEIAAVEITDSINELQKLFIETRLSKIMVYRESIDHIIGYVHSFELFQKPEHIQHVLRPVSFIPEPMPANEVLELFIKQKRNVVVVVDEFGGTAGIVTMEDVVEEIFGEIEDEHDRVENVETIVSEGIYELSARLEIDYINEKYNLQLPVDNDEYDTLSGLIVHLRGDIPEENERIELEKYTLIPVVVNEKTVEIARLEVHN